MSVIIGTHGGGRWQYATSDVVLHGFRRCVCVCVTFSRASLKRGVTEVGHRAAATSSSPGRERKIVCLSTKLHPE